MRRKTMKEGKRFLVSYFCWVNKQEGLVQNSEEYYSA